jgi:RHS repeat-associated protein
VYDALGTKLSKTVKTGTTTNYVQDDRMVPIANRKLSAKKALNNEGTVQSIAQQGVFLIYNSPSGLNRKIEATYHSEDDQMVSIANRKSSAKKALDKEETATNWIAAYTILQTKIIMISRALRPTGSQLLVIYNTTNNEILQENHYYAFDDRAVSSARRKFSATKALNSEGNATNWIASAYFSWMYNDASKDNAYMYNSKEYNADHGLKWSDYGARWYDAAIGRWTMVDPMSEKTSTWSGYNYVENNPMSKFDPTGMYSESNTNFDLATGAAKRISGGDAELTKDKNGAWVEKSSGNSNAQSSGDPIVKATDKNKSNISKVSWGETSGLYPTKTMNPSEKEKYNPKQWDAEKLKQLLAARAGIQLVSTRNSTFHTGSPNLKDVIQKVLASYHLTDNFPNVDPAIKDDEVNYFYLSNSTTKIHGDNQINTSFYKAELVKTYGPFYNNGGGDINRGESYIHFFKAVKIK